MTEGSHVCATLMMITLFYHFTYHPSPVPLVACRLRVCELPPVQPDQ